MKVFTYHTHEKGEHASARSMPRHKRAGWHKLWACGINNVQRVFADEAQQGPRTSPLASSHSATLYTARPGIAHR